MASRVPTDEEFDKFTKDQIVEFLRSRNKRRTGKKAELLAYAKSVAKDSEDFTVDTTVLRETIERRKVFEEDTLVWNPFEVLKPSDFPSNFGLSEIDKFLTNFSIQIGKNAF